MTKASILIDSNVLLDIFQDDPRWFDWSEQTLDRYARTHVLCINPIIYSELSISFAAIEDLERVLHTAHVRLLTLPKEALFLAGKVFLDYRKRGGTKTTALPDFFIGAHAAVQRLPLITRDVKRYRTNYPTVALIAPS